MTARKNTGLVLRWALLALALLSVLAPVWADIYRCPMQREADRRAASCCERALQADADAYGAWERACDCPKVVWQIQPGDRTPVLLGPDSVLVAVSDVAFALPVRRATGSVRGVRLSGVPEGPPLWLRFRSILC